MAVSDILITVGIFLAFGYLILSKLKEKNPKRHAQLMGMFKGAGKLKDKIKSEDKTTQVISSENARIM